MLRPLACSLLVLCFSCATDRSSAKHTPFERPKPSAPGLSVWYPLHPSEMLATELADRASLDRLAQGRDAVPVFSDLRFELQSSEDRATGEAYLLYLLQNGNRDMANFVCRSVAAQIGATYPSPHYDLPACPESWVEGVVLARFEGAGTLSRLWLATKTIAKQLPDKLRLRIYRDRQARAVVDVPLRELLDGSNPVFAEPFGMPQTTQVGWYYPVVFSDGLIIAIDEVPRLDAVYYQAQVTRDGEHGSPPEALLAQREAARRVLTAPLLAADGPSVASSVPPKAEQALFDLAGPATIESFALTAPSLAALDAVRVRVFWDGAHEPAIDLPARELFGSALAAPELSSSWLGSEQTREGLRLTLALPMPFRSHARVVVQNEGDESVALRASIALKRGVPKRAFGNLHALRNETKGPTKATHHPLAHAQGRGRWVGLCVALEGHAWSHPAFSEPLNFLEGDPSTLIDGVESLRGTGTEDIFDSVFYFQNSPLVTPFVQTWGVDKEHGQASACRWSMHGSELDFSHSLDAELEIGPGRPELLDRYRTVAFVYQ